MYKKVLFVLSIIAILAVYGACSARTESRLSDALGNWAYPQISYLVSEGIIKGYPDNTFKPDNPITKAEFIVIVNRALGFEVFGAVSYTDVNRWDWYYEDIGRAEAAGYLSDSRDDKLEPEKYITREEAAAIIAAALKLDTSKDGTVALTDILDVSREYREAVLAVVKTGYMVGYPDRTFLPQESITRAEAAVILYKCCTRPEDISTYTINVLDFGARGDGQSDDTAAIQRAIDYGRLVGSGRVFIPEGVYLIDADIAVKPQNNTQIRLDDNATLKAKPTQNAHYAILLLENVDNVKIVGGNIVGERHDHLGNAGEWGMGISILGSRNISIRDMAISDCWGDGIYIAGSKNISYSENVAIERFSLHGNRRQGISIISVKDLAIRDGMISDTNGTRPQSGLDLEPNRTSDYLQNILIENLLTINNAGYGIECWFGCGTSNTLQFPPERVNIAIGDHIDRGSNGGTLHNIQFYVRNGYKINVE